MQTLLRSRVTAIWILLVAATGVSWALGHGMGFSSIRAASSAVIVVAFIKVRFVIQEFMEIRTAPRFMRVIAETWLVAICAVLLALYWTAARGPA
jgi:Prokaryotic Cytochrome C oxidase subunit IV